MEKLKLLICDDELNIRQGLKCILDWDELGFIICGEASNGKDAVTQAIDLEPDLIILDIKMPGLTGIEVISQIKDYCEKNGRLMPSIIILSGYAEFEYAQKTVNLGAKAYLLKPVDEDELQKKVEEIKQQIKDSKASISNSKSVKEITEKEQLLKILKSRSPELETKPATEFFKNSAESTYQAIILSSEYCVQFNKEAYLKSMDNYFSFFTNQILPIGDNILICLKTQNQQAVEKCIERAARLNPENNFILAGKPYQGLVGLQNSYKEALALENFLFFNNTRIYITKELIGEPEKVSQKDVDDLINTFVFCIETYDKKQLSNKYFELKQILIKGDNIQEIRQLFIYILMEVRNRLQNRHQERELTDGQTKDIVPEILKARNFTECFNFVTDVLDDFVEHFNFNTADSVIIKVIAYVKANYDKDLKLEMLGDLFNCNSAYLGKKFTKQTGVQFNTYLDNLRIEAAKDKLLNTDLKIYQISKLVGYANTDYFFMKFKKSTGLTPKEFQKQAGKNGESD